LKPENPSALLFDPADIVQLQHLDEHEIAV